MTASGKVTSLGVPITHFKSFATYKPSVEAHSPRVAGPRAGDRVNDNAGDCASQPRASLSTTISNNIPYHLGDQV